MPVWPGDTHFAQEETWSIGPGCPVRVSKVTLSTHCGAHADAPAHYDAAGVAVAGLDLGRYLGPARLIDVVEAGPLIGPEHVRPALTADCPPRLLLRTYARAPTGWDDEFTAVAPETIALLARHGVLLVGIDTPSLDPMTSKSMDAHHAVRRHGLSILEGLVFDAAVAGDWELIALPLKLADLDAAPVRAVLRRPVP